MLEYLNEYCIRMNVCVFQLPNSIVNVGIKAINETDEYVHFLKRPLHIVTGCTAV